MGAGSAALIPRGSPPGVRRPTPTHAKGVTDRGPTVVGGTVRGVHAADLDGVMAVLDDLWPDRRETRAAIREAYRRVLADDDEPRAYGRDEVEAALRAFHAEGAPMPPRAPLLGLRVIRERLPERERAAE